MRKFVIFLSIPLALFGCDSMKTTKELCKASGNSALIRARIEQSDKSGLDDELKKALAQKDVPFLQCLMKHNYDNIMRKKASAKYEKCYYDNYFDIKYIDKDKCKKANSKTNSILIQAISSHWDAEDISPLLSVIKNMYFDDDWLYEFEINATNSEGSSPLMIACSYGDIDLVKLLLEKGAQLNFLSDSGQTPLLAAVSSGNLELVKFLIEKGAGKNLGNSTLSQALSLQDKEKAEQIATYLLNIGVKYSSKDLVTVAGAGMEKMVDKLLALGVNPNTGFNTYTPLMAASRAGHAKIVQRLLNSGAGRKHSEWRHCENYGYLNLPKGLNQTHVASTSDFVYSENALFEAVSAGNIEVAMLLLRAGANPNYDTSLICEQDRPSQKWYENKTSGCFTTPLIEASSKGDTEMIKLLIKYGAKLNYECVGNITTGTYDTKQQRVTRRTAFSVAKNEETRNLLARLGAEK